MEEKVGGELGMGQAKEGEGKEGGSAKMLPGFASLKTVVSMQK